MHTGQTAAGHAFVVAIGALLVACSGILPVLGELQPAAPASCKPTSLGETFVVAPRIPDSASGATSSTNSTLWNNEDPALLRVAGSMLLVFKSNRTGGSHLFSRIGSASSATQWGPAAQITDSSGEDNYPTLATCGSPGKIALAWFRINATSRVADIWFARSADGGRSWGSPQQLTNEPSTDWVPRMSFDDASGTLYLVWASSRRSSRATQYRTYVAAAGIAAVVLSVNPSWCNRYMMSSEDCGTTWSPPQVVYNDQDGITDSFPDVLVTPEGPDQNSSLFVIFTRAFEGSHTQKQLWATRSYDCGHTWQHLKPITSFSSAPHVGTTNTFASLFAATAGASPDVCVTYTSNGFSPFGNIAVGPMLNTTAVVTVGEGGLFPQYSGHVAWLESSSRSTGERSLLVAWVSGPNQSTPGAHQIQVRIAEFA